MLDKSLYFILSNFPLCMCIFSLLIALSSHNKFNHRFFTCLLFFAVGLGGIWGFIMHAFFSSITTNNIGWKASPFEFEIALANLALGVAGIIAAFANWSYRAAVVTVTTVFLWGAASGHIYQIIISGNLNPGNAGAILWTDILIPLLLLILLPLTYLKKSDNIIYY